jgi:hypothetical protein
MKKISKNRQLRLNKINISKLNAQHVQAILGGNTANTCVQKTHEETCSESCTTSRTTVDFGGTTSQDTNC